MTRSLRGPKRGPLRIPVTCGFPALETVTYPRRRHPPLIDKFNFEDLPQWIATTAISTAPSSMMRPYSR
jgi:hypothetical protein